MISLCLVDMALTGVYVAVAGRIDVVPGLLVKNLLILGLLNAIVAARIYRPVHRFVAAPPSARDSLRDAARHCLRNLPGRSALWAFVLSIGYCTYVFVSGEFTPNTEQTRNVDFNIRAIALLWFVLVFATYYSFYIYFIVSDFAADLRARTFESDQLVIEAKSRRFGRKIIIVFVVVAIVPNVHLILDLTVFAEFRRAQGFGVVQTVFVDLFANLVVFCMALLFVTRSLTRPVNNLLQVLDEVGRGDLEARAPVTADDEIGVLTASFNRMVEGLEERAFIRDTFGKYVPESVAAAIVAERGPIEPRLVTATILYSDIANFTTISERLAPPQVVEMLNEYFSAVIEPIERHSGVVNQFQGDAMLVTFNVPVEDPQHARQALQTALEIRHATHGRTFAGVKLETRIGINTGLVIAGNVGSKGRYNYTVHGDAVNVAARLEQLNKDYGTTLLVSENTVSALDGDHRLEIIGEAPVRGKRETVTIFGIRRSADDIETHLTAG